MPGVFLSYRRSDAGGWAGRLKDHLVLRFGPDRVWQDADDLTLGTDCLPQTLRNITGAGAIPTLPDTLNKLDQLQIRYFQQLTGKDSLAAAAIARKGLQLLDDQMPNYPHDHTLQLFRGFFLKNLAMALRDSGDTPG